jgi:ABC-2 type transport system ATP-binding protein
MITAMGDLAAPRERLSDDAVIEIEGLHKSYKRFRRPAERAVDGIDIVVPRGGVHGFLGPNGSGKTTTIRMLLGLVAADSGRMRVLGHDVPSALPQVIGGVGALVETPLFFPAFTGRRNLQLLATTARTPARRVDEVLELVGLAGRDKDKVKGYSLGMRQRLGIAAALLKEPALLILDEPSNGLDPAGIVEMRELVRRLGSDGRTTVFLSSHLLGEVQQVCDRVTILAHGKVVADGPVGEVLATRATGDVRVRVADPIGAKAVLDAAGISATSTGEAWLVHGVDDPARITRVLADAGHYVSELTPLTADLESVFLDLTTDGDHA